MSSSNNSSKFQSGRKPRHNTSMIKHAKSRKLNKSGNPVIGVHLLSGDIAFPPKLRSKFRVVYNIGNAWSSAGTTNYIAAINNPINVIASQIMSGLAFLISGPKTDGTAFAPYTIGVVRKVKINVYLKTVATSTNAVGALFMLFPLPVGATSSGMNLTQVEEQFGRSNVVEVPSVPETNSHQKPSISRTFDIAKLIGVDEHTYLNNPLDYGFNYNGPLGSTQPVCVNLFGSTDNGSADATLITRINLEYIVEIEFSARNTLITSAPHV